jgi:hypothetical protein
MKVAGDSLTVWGEYVNRSLHGQLFQARRLPFPIIRLRRCKPTGDASAREFGLVSRTPL